MWTNQEIEFLKINYPQHGKMWCVKHLEKTEQQIRHKASALKLKQDRNSKFFKDWQNRAKLSKIGKKRPDQGLVMKKLHEDGKLSFTEQRKKAISVRMKKQWLEKEHPRGALGMKHTKETKEKISKKSKAHWNNMSKEKRANMLLKAQKTKVANGTNIHIRKTSWKAGWREIGGINKYYRSRWEANYARYLEMLKNLGQIKSWLHEPTTFWFEKIMRGTRSYLPDFLVVGADDSEIYHEVKGWMDSKSLTKLKRMKIYHPNVQIKLVEKKEYMEIGKAYSQSIPDWEYDAKGKV